MPVKDDIIRVRVSKEQKELFKSIAKSKNISMSEFMVVATEKRALQEKEKLDNKESLEKRTIEMEEMLKVVKSKMDERKPKKKSLFKKIFGVGLQIED